MFGLDRAWWIVPLILVIVLVIWGPGKMPEVGAGLGKAFREFRSAVSGAREAVHDAVVVDSVSATKVDSTTEQPRPSPQPATAETDGIAPR
jgi:TatA/E family protein of Tat protein translocase